MDPSTGGQGPPAEAVQEATAALHPHDRETEEGVVAEMASMYRHDRAMAIAFVVALLIVLPFIIVAMWDEMPDTATRLVLIGAAIVLAIYNCASMLVLVRNYGADHDFIYRRDVAHLRLLRAARRSRS
jgi:hypothetical protein